MRLVCSYCRQVIRHDPGTSVKEVSHGMCHSCAEHFGKLWNGMSLSEYLDGLPDPVLVVDGDGRVVGLNERLALRLGRDGRDLRGLLAGEAFACSRSRLPEGCGKTVHCRECTIRLAVTHVRDTKRDLVRAPAWLQTKQGRVSLLISVRPEQGLVKVTVEEMKAPERAATGP